MPTKRNKALQIAYALLDADNIEIANELVHEHIDKAIAKGDKERLRELYKIERYIDEARSE